MFLPVDYICVTKHQALTIYTLNCKTVFSEELSLQLYLFSEPPVLFSCPFCRQSTSRRTILKVDDMSRIETSRTAWTALKTESWSS